MNGKEILVDTNILIKLLSGDDTLANFLQGRFLFISFVTDLEMHGLKKPSKEYIEQRRLLLNDCFVIPLNNEIRNLYIKLRQATNLTLADSIIAATAGILKIPFISSDAAFKGVNKIDFIFYEPN